MVVNGVLFGVMTPILSYCNGSHNKSEGRLLAVVGYGRDHN